MTAKIRIERDPLVMSGQPCVAGTRWPTVTALHWHERGCTPEQIAAHYDQAGITPEAVRACLAYERRWHRRAGRVFGRWRCRAAGWLCERCRDWGCG